MESLTNFLNKAKSTKLKIAVVGDSMIDEYYAVRVNRISPEFPIPVLLSENSDKPINRVPGGAANVCCQLSNWNVDVYLVSALTEQCIDVFKPHKFDYSYSTMLSDWRMPIKKRFYDGDFPLKRWDVEDSKSNLKTSEWTTARMRLYSEFIYMLGNIKPDIVVLSDYGKGVFVNGIENISKDLIEFCNRDSIPTVVDPKIVNPNLWKGCTILKPNADWAKAFYEKYDCCQIFDIKKAVGSQSVVITESGNGVDIVYENDSITGVRAVDEVDKDKFNCYIKAPDLSKNRPVIRSVIGAGDCFMSFLVMAKALGLDLIDSVKVAFNGASAYIEDKHNAPVIPYRFHKWFDPIEAKKVSIEELTKIKSQLGNKTWVWTNGVFDILHHGHLKTFKEAKKLGDKVVVGLNTDKSVKLLKGDSRPIITYKEREDLLANLQYVDFVVPINDKTPEKLIEQLKPNKIVKGGDYKIEDIHGWEVVGKENVHLVPLTNSSTSKIIDRIKNG